MTTMAQKQNNKVVVALVALVFIMLGASFAAVPLYNYICRVTGFSGTTQEVVENSGVVVDREMTVRFTANTMADMPWEFRPKTPSMKVKIGETNLVMYEAYNPTDKVITGTAAYNVAPLELGAYFNKIECFCFVEQTLQPGERVDMPVTFFVDPELADDPDVADMHSVTLSYTFNLTSVAPEGKTAPNETDSET